MCGLTCSYYHDKVFNPQVSWIKIEKNEHTNNYSPQICLQYSNVPCMKVCPTVFSLISKYQNKKNNR